MADGGLRDQLGGGFHRYSTDARWLVPHFEQMLYDNAQLARVYVHAWALTGDARYRAVATGTLDYLIRELTTDDGAFAASQDADTDGIEGLTFTWRAPEIRERARRRRAGAVRRGLRRDRRGQLGGRHDPVAGRRRRGARRARFGLTVAGGRERRARRRPRSRLLARRQTRPQPARDDKALAAWNGLAIAALADAAIAFGDRSDRRDVPRRRRAGGDDDRRRAARRRRLARAVVEGRSRGRVRRARGLHASRRWPPGAL